MRLPLARDVKFTENGQRLAEMFKIERGLIGPVESVLHQAPYGIGSG